ncbi:hypothetical protein LJC58_07900 [Lachnospiraceae bacterium OttesenSCG-928-D06]|nr:hypothetical protein [Lachnospiraceae bacterium OttesenSCG-928-D06]
MREINKLVLTLIGLILILSGCNGGKIENDFTAEAILDDKGEIYNAFEDNFIDNSNTISNTENSNKFENSMSAEAKEHKEKIVRQIEYLNNNWITDEALFANRLINKASEENLEKLFYLNDDFDIVFDNDVYAIVSIDIIDEEELSRIYSFSSDDVRGYQNLTLFVLDISEGERYEKIHIMIDNEIQSIYCYIHKNESITGFYKASMIE